MCIRDSCYIVSREKDCIIVDPGTRYPIELEDYIERNKLNPRYISVCTPIRGSS